MTACLLPMKLDLNLISLTYVTTDILEEEEVLVYPVDSLISEFGGALGLFLGFSFLGLATTIGECLAKFFSKISCKWKT